MRARTTLALVGISFLLLSQVGRPKPGTGDDDSDCDPASLSTTAGPSHRRSPKARLRGTVAVCALTTLGVFGIVASLKGFTTGFIALTGAGAVLVALGGIAQVKSHLHRLADAEVAQDSAVSAMAFFGMGGVMLAVDPVVKVSSALFSFAPSG